MRALNLVGQKINMLTVIRREPFSGGRTKFLVRCDCGVEKIVSGKTLNQRKLKSCGCYLKSTEGRNQNGINRRGEWGEASRNRVISMYKSNSKNRNIPFTLSKESMIKMFSEKCFYCGALPYKTVSGGRYGPFTYTGIDRKNSLLGYTSDNCVPCCEKCNYFKNSYSYEEFLIQVKKIYEHCNLSTVATFSTDH